MDIIETIMNAQGGTAVQQLGAQLGLDQGQAASALTALLPALAAGFQKNAGSEGGLSSLASALASGNHQRYIDDPATLTDEAAVADGNGILGHLFGSKEVSRQVASRAAAQTGVSSDIIKRMLPLAAAMMMGAMSRKTAGGSALSGAAAGGGLAAMLGPLLDSNRDGSILDDVTGMVGKFLGR
jgi:hypothetical protein